MCCGVEEENGSNVGKVHNRDKVNKFIWVFRVIITSKTNKPQCPQTLLTNKPITLSGCNILLLNQFLFYWVCLKSHGKIWPFFSSQTSSSSLSLSLGFLIKHFLSLINFSHPFNQISTIIFQFSEFRFHNNSSFDMNS